MDQVISLVNLQASSIYSSIKFTSVNNLIGLCKNINKQSLVIIVKSIQDLGWLFEAQ